jgi:hypothetical protein
MSTRPAPSLPRAERPLDRREPLRLEPLRDDPPDVEELGDRDADEPEGPEGAEGAEPPEGDPEAADAGTRAGAAARPHTVQ